MSKTTNRLVTKLRVSDRYVAAQWDYQKWGHDKDADKKRIDGVYTVYTIKTLGFYKDPKKYSLVVNGLTLKVEEKISALVKSVKDSLRKNLDTLSKKYPEEPETSGITITSGQHSNHELVLPSSADTQVSTIVVEFMSLFYVANQISASLYRLNKMNILSDNKFRSQRYELLKPLRVGMNDISKLAKDFHKLRKSKRL